MLKCILQFKQSIFIFSNLEFNKKIPLLPTLAKLLRTSRQVFVTVTSIGSLERTLIDILGGGSTMFLESSSSSSSSGASSSFFVI